MGAGREQAHAPAWGCAMSWMASWVICRHRQRGWGWGREARRLACPACCAKGPPASRLPCPFGTLHCSLQVPLGELVRRRPALLTTSSKVPSCGSFSSSRPGLRNCTLVAPRREASPRACLQRAEKERGSGSVAGGGRGAGAAATGACNLCRLSPCRATAAGEGSKDGKVGPWSRASKACMQGCAPHLSASSEMS